MRTGMRPCFAAGTGIDVYRGGGIRPVRLGLLRLGTGGGGGGRAKQGKERGTLDEEE